MLLACNYTAELTDLMARGEAPVDYIKAGAFGPFLDKLSEMRKLRPVLLHGLGSVERTGMPGFGAYDYARANRLLRECGSPHLAIHIAITNADAAPGMTREALHARMAACAAAFMKNIEVPLLLENIGDAPEERTVFDLVPFAAPEDIGRLIRETGAGLLLDIAHAKVTALYHGWDARAYMSALPLGKVREIHVSGAGFGADGAPRDAHGPMAEEDYALLEWALGHTDPDIVTLEYGWPRGGPDQAGADREALRGQLARLRAMLPGPAGGR
jgi:uncharacterized protein (UPF0276 family)